VAYNYYGVSGWTELDELGDRKALNVDFFAVKDVEGWLYLASSVDAFSRRVIGCFLRKSYYV